MGWAKKRRFPRFEPEALTFAVLRHQRCMVGRVVSVSKGGLAFEYVPLNQIDTESDLEEDSSTALDLIIGRAPMYVPQIPCEILYDYKAKPECFLADEIATRCCGLKFGELSEEQQDALEALLEEFVTAAI